MNSENIIKKKVKPYPIECVLTGKAQPVNGKIVKLTEVGFLVNVGREFFRTLEVFTVDFLLPVSKDAISSQVKVITTYDNYKEPNGASSRLIEMQFTHLPDAQSKSIYNFLVAIKQIKS